jgi:hypothetical protein
MTVTRTGITTAYGDVRSLPCLLYTSIRGRSILHLNRFGLVIKVFSMIISFINLLIVDIGLQYGLHSEQAPVLGKALGCT